MTRCDSGHCVEVLVEQEDIYVWDTKEPGVRLRFTVDEWTAFLTGAVLGEFNPLPDIPVEDPSLEHES